MRVCIMFIFFLSFLTSCQEPEECQYIKDYFPLTSTAAFYIDIGNYEEAYNLYSQVFEVCEPIRLTNHNDLYDYAKCAVKLGKQNTKEIIIHSFKQGVSIDSYKGDKDFHPFIYYDQWQKTEDWNVIERIYQEIRQQYLQKVNYELRDSIYRLQELDQEYRRRSDLPDSLRRVKGIRRDIEVQRALHDLIIEYGFIDIPAIGGIDIDGRSVSISAILLHTPDSVRVNYWIPYLQEEINKGNCSPYTLGAMIDQLHLYNGKKAKLGVMVGSQIESKEEADRLRLKIGLPPYEVDSIKWDRLRIK